MSDTPRTDHAFKDSHLQSGFIHEFCRGIERELAQAKKQLVAREARIAQILSNLQQYKDDPYIEAAICFTQDDLLILREHEAEVLEEAADFLYQADMRVSAGELRRMAQERRNQNE